jgi:ankyrin repeat protein
MILPPLEELEGYGLSVRLFPFVGQSPVHSAASGRRESVLRYLLDRGGDPVRPDLRGTTPLHFAAEEGVFCFWAYI